MVDFVSEMEVPVPARRSTASRHLLLGLATVTHFTSSDILLTRILMLQRGLAYYTWYWAPCRLTFNCQWFLLRQDCEGLNTIFCPSQFLLSTQMCLNPSCWLLKHECAKIQIICHCALNVCIGAIACGQNNETLFSPEVGAEMALTKLGSV